MKPKVFYSIIILFLLSFPYVMGIEADELHIFGVDAEEIIILASSILALTLFGVTLVAYQRDKRKRLLYITIAFFLFAVKGFLISSELFLTTEIIWIDPVASILDFVILTSFFLGIMGK